MAKVFISFIHEEESAATDLSRFLKEIFADSIELFQSSDKTVIYAGENWMDRIFSELKDAKVLLSMLSKESVTRPWINFEAGAAWMRDIKVIPVCFRGMTVGTLPKPYSSIQATEIESLEGAYYLVSSIAHHLGVPIPRKPFLGPKAALSLVTPNPEEQIALRAPYMRLMFGLDVKISDLTYSDLFIKLPTQ